MSHGEQPRRATGNRRGVLWIALALMLCWPVVSSLASPERGRANRQPVRRSSSVALTASRRQKLAELDVAAAAVKLLPRNVLTGTATVSNLGAARARSSTAGVAWKSATSGGLVRIGRFAVPALKPGRRHNADFKIDLPKRASGSYEVSVCADVLGQIQEQSKKNNCRSAGVITIGHPGPAVKKSLPIGSQPPSPGSSPGGSTPSPGSPGTGPPPASSPPDTVIDSGPTGTIGQASVTFTFHGSDASDTSQCSLDDAPWVACTSPQSYTALAEGVHTFRVRAINSAGEIDPTPAGATFTVDATPPVVTLATPTSGSETNHNTPTFSGTAGTAPWDSSTVTVQIYAGSAATGTPVQTLSTTASGGAWSVVVFTALADGTYTAQGTQGDEAGHTGTSTSTTFTVDTVAPAVSLTAPANGSGTDNTIPTFSGVAGTAPGDKPAITVKVYQSSSPSGTPVQTLSTTASGAGWSVAASGALTEGTYTAQAEQGDAAGNTGASTANTFTVETAPPQTTITSAPSGRVPIGEVSISFASTEAGSSFRCSLDGAAYTPCSSPDVIKDPAAGPHTFKVQATNQAGIKETAPPPSASWSSVEPQHDLCGTIAANTTIGPNYAARYVVTCSTTVASNATLTAQSGTIIKAEQGTQVSVEGALDAVGTEVEPITFTSVNDNSVGGTTGLVPPESGDWSGLSGRENSSLVLQGVVIRYAALGVESSGGGLSMLGVVVSGAEQGVEAYYSTMFSLTGSSVSARNSPVSVVSPSAAVTVTGNSLTSTGASDGLSVDQAPVVAVAHNTVATVGIQYPAVTVDSPDVNFAELETNTLSASGGTPRVSVGGSVVKSQTWAPQPFGWSIESAPLNVAAGVTLTMAPGLTVKSNVARCDEQFGTCYEGGTGNVFAAIGVQGSLIAEGTSANPVTLTSINDNSIGGATGTKEPKAEDWDGIYAGKGATVKLEHTTLDYAQTALTAADGTEVAVHGTILNSTVGVSADTYVDATNVNWGSPSGPAPIGTGTPIQGEGVLAAPWVGFNAPSKPPPVESGSPPVTPCDDVVFIGVRGSGQYSNEVMPYATDTATQEKLLGVEIGLVYGAAKLKVFPQTIEPVAVEYPALPVPSLTNLAVNPYFDNLWEGVYAVEDALIDEEVRCKGTAKFVLAGFSSGAFAVHQALAELVGSKTISPNLVAAIVLLADPAKLGNGEEQTIGSADPTADGIYTKLFGSEPAIAPGAIPYPLGERTISLCNKDDAVCAPGVTGAHARFGFPYDHASYSPAEAEYLGEWAGGYEKAGK